MISPNFNQIVNLKLANSLKPKVFKDERGFFYESWNENDWKKILKLTTNLKFCSR